MLVQYILLNCPTNYSLIDSSRSKQSVKKETRAFILPRSNLDAFCSIESTHIIPIIQRPTIDFALFITISPRFSFILRFWLNRFALTTAETFESFHIMEKIIFSSAKKSDSVLVIIPLNSYLQVFKNIVQNFIWFHLITRKKYIWQKSFKRRMKKLVYFLWKKSTCY